MFIEVKNGNEAMLINTAHIECVRPLSDGKKCFVDTDVLVQGRQNTYVADKSYKEFKKLLLGEGDK